MEEQELSLDALELIDPICMEFERALKSGNRPRLEDHLGDTTFLASDSVAPNMLFKELLFSEVDHLTRMGLLLDEREYKKRFPAFASEIDLVFRRGTVAESSHSASGPERFQKGKFLGEGGSGRVFEAIDVLMRRIVAIKELKSESGDEISNARFRHEAVVTAWLEHPGVVPVYTKGEFKDGQQFYAMRRIQGTTLRDAVRDYHRDEADGRNGKAREGVFLAELLRKFLNVCDTVAYAHSRGVIHRDLKPSNIMLGPFGETFVVDWGNAKFLEIDNGVEEDSVSALQSIWFEIEETCTGTFAGTPAYMSPEQLLHGLGQSQVSVGQSSDLYSLGVTLYEITTGILPFSGSRDAGQMIHSIRSGEFPTPRERKPQVPAELEAIILTAMALEPGDRYASVEELSKDLKRYLAGESVSVYQDPIHVRFRRWLYLHPKLTSAVSIAVVLLFGFLAYSYERQVTFNNQLQSAYQDVQENYDLSKDAIETYLDKVAANPRLQESDFQELRAELLETALPFYEQLLERQPGDQQVEAGRANASRRLGRIYFELGKVEDGVNRLSDALQGYRELQEKKNTGDYQQQMAEVRSLLGSTLLRQGRFREAESEFREVIDTYRSLPHGDSGSLARELAAARNNLATSLLSQNRQQEALEALQRAAEDFRALASHNPLEHNLKRSLAAVLTNSGLCRVDMGDRLAAVQDFDSATGLLREAISQSPQLTYRKELANLLQASATAFKHLGKVPDAISKYEESLQILIPLCDEFPSYVELHMNLATTHSSIASIHRRNQDFQKARSSFLNAIADLEDLAERFPDIPVIRSDLATCQMNFAMMLGDFGESDLAGKMAENALAQRQLLVEEFPENHNYAYELASTFLARGVTFAEEKQIDLATSDFKESIRRFEVLWNRAPTDDRVLRSLSGAISNLGWMLYQEEKTEEARACLLRSIAYLDPVVERRPESGFQEDLCDHRCLLITLQLKLGEYEESAKHLELARASGRKLWENDKTTPRHAIRMARLAHLSADYHRQAENDVSRQKLRFDESIQLLTPVVERQPSLIAAKELLVSALKNRAEINESQEEFSDAARDWHRAAELTNGEQRQEFLENASRISDKPL